MKNAHQQKMTPIPHASRVIAATETHYCEARRWRQLGAFLDEVLADAVHTPVCLQGAQPELIVLLSRHLLQPEAVALARISARLEQSRVPHSFSYVIAGAPEPGAHKVLIQLVLNGRYSTP